MIHMECITSISCMQGHVVWGVRGVGGFSFLARLMGFVH